MRTAKPRASRPRNVAVVQPFAKGVKVTPFMQVSRSHNVAVVELLKEDPDFASVYLAAALGESGQPGGQQALLAALRHVAEAQGMAAVAQRAGMPRESLYRALSVNSNPTIKTLLAVLGAAGLQLAVTRPQQAA